MKTRFFKIAIAVGVLSVSAMPVGFAQDGNVGQIEINNKMSTDEKLSFSEQAMGEMRADVQYVSRLMETAEREKDPVKIQCLGKKLTTMRALVEVTENSNTSMRQAITAGENDRADHEFRKIQVALAKVKQFRSEAEACLGGGDDQTGTTQVEVIDAGLSYEGEIDDAVTFDDGVFYDKPIDTSRFEQ